MSIGQGILLGATIGGLSGGAAAGVSAIGGGAMLAGAAGGAVGGAAADITGQLLSTGDVNLGQSLLAGGMSFGLVSCNVLWKLQVRRW